MQESNGVGKSRCMVIQTFNLQGILKDLKIYKKGKIQNWIKYHYLEAQGQWTKTGKKINKLHHGHIIENVLSQSFWLDKIGVKPHTVN